MKVSIITPTLNSEKYILENLESVHLWQNKNIAIEQIIVDGNSTDQTIDIVKSFKQKYNANIEIIQSKDKNMYDAINKGLKAVTGNIWACLNSDDIYNPKAITLVVNEFNKNPDLDVVYGYLDIIDENGIFLRKKYLPKFNLNYLILRKHCSTINQPASFLQKRVIDDIGYFNINYNYASDYDYFIRVGSKCKMKLIKKSITKFRQHETSISYNKKSQNIQWNESDLISKKYIEDLSINQANLYKENLRYYIIQIKLINSRFLLSQILETAKSNSWKDYIKLLK